MISLSTLFLKSLHTSNLFGILYYKEHNYSVTLFFLAPHGLRPFASHWVWSVGLAASGCQPHTPHKRGEPPAVARRPEELPKNRTVFENASPRRSYSI